MTETKGAPISELVTKLAQARQEIENSSNDLAAIEDEIQLVYGLALMDARANVTAAKSLEKVVAGDLRAEGILQFELDGIKKAHPAIAIREYTVLDYDPKAALDYCIAHVPKALSMKKAVFEKAAKVLDLDFVEISKEPRTTIARDLSRWVER